ncbi:MAG TPA: EscU/YscU/HrcU family type III secretion system export apparatus switch protein [Chitinispirillaceae bacterium]|nr:EscU/YscU/HrcU family type III secretion system export apparatus switch protein [Chitinispirillaceae bacterium]
MKTEKKRDKAVAISYNEEKDNAPRVTAKGSGVTAQRIREIAEANGIPVHKDDDLLELLSQIDIDREIPPELYTAVAEVLCWIYQAELEMKREIQK